MNQPIPWPEVGVGAFLAVLAWLSYIDLTERRLPNRIVGPLTVGTLAWVVVAGIVGGDPGRSLRAIAIGVAASAVLLGLSLVGRLGAGDIKLATPIGVVAGWLGPGASQVTAATAALSVLAVAATMTVTGRGRQTLPFGPFLALGSLAGILFAGWANT